MQQNDWLRKTKKSKRNNSNNHGGFILKRGWQSSEIREQIRVLYICDKKRLYIPIYLLCISSEMDDIIDNAI